MTTSTIGSSSGPTDQKNKLIANILEDLARRQKILPPITSLTFLSPPSSNDPEPLPTTNHDPNASDPLTLSFRDPANTPTIDHEMWLGQQIDRLTSMEFRSSDHAGKHTRENTLESLNKEFGRVQQEKLNIWITQRRSQRHSEVFDAIDLKIRKPRGAATLETCELNTVFWNQSH